MPYVRLGGPPDPFFSRDLKKKYEQMAVFPLAEAEKRMIPLLKSSPAWGDRSTPPRAFG